MNLTLNLPRTKTLCMALLMALPAILPQVASAADSSVKREMRSAWVATVWRLDWPKNLISQTGNQTEINRQKKDLVTLLDSLSVNNFNAVNLQVRSRCEALYKSSYEPWSNEIVETRGMDPGYDPLEFAVQECHARGMECHAWINPYRYESVAHQWDVNGQPCEYRASHPDWLMDVTSSNGTTATILNPGLPEVTQRICDIVKEIVSNYDVDGLLFDDYFYLSGTPASLDDALWNQYRENGGTLSKADWRRDNVNRMIAAVNQTIKETKPWVRFGVSPAGIACTSSTVARNYGISPCPTGSDWQYNDIYSDPIAWISQQSLDYISPQIYWTIGYSTDYEKACKWWSEVAAKWDRHMFSSHSISSLTASSKAPVMSNTENAIHRASGQNSTTFEEYANEIRLNRKYTLNDAPGSIFYSAKYLYYTAPLMAHHLRKTVFNTQALVPAMSWFPVSNPGTITGLGRSGANLSWSGPENVRYTIYAVPTSVPQQNFAGEAEYLLGTAYTPSFTLPQNRISGYNYAVCVLDRYGNEYSPVFLGVATKDLDAPTLLFPAKDETVEMPFNFQWQPVENATSYIVEIASDAAMTNLLYTHAVSATELSTDVFYQMPIEKEMYWRVRSCGVNYNDGLSEVRKFTPRQLQITAPEFNAANVSLTPEVKWSYGEREITLQISTNEDFTESAIVYQTTATNGSCVIPKYKLAAYTTYYIRAIYQRNGVECISPFSTFSTREVETVVPSISHPQANGTLHADEAVQVNPIEGAKRIRLEINDSPTLTGRYKYASTNFDTQNFVDSKTGEQIVIAGKGALEDSKTYYAHVQAAFNTENGESVSNYSEVIPFVYSAEPASVESITIDEAKCIIINTTTGLITVSVPSPTVLRIYDLTGLTVALLNVTTTGTVNFAIPDLTPGVYIASIDCAPNSPVKFAIK